MRLTGLWWWIDRWRKSSAFTGMTLEEQGAYRNLLDEAALRGGPIPDDDNVLARACGDARKWRKVRASVLARFYRAADGWRNETLDAVIAESQRRSEKQRAYRNRDGNDGGNGSGNEGGNTEDNKRDLSDSDSDNSSGSSATKTGKAGSRAETERVGWFMDRYRELHEQYVGVAYLGNPVKDYQAACELVATFNDGLLEKIAVFGLNDPDPFMAKDTRTLSKLKVRASGYAQQLRDRRLA